MKDSKNFFCSISLQCWLQHQLPILFDQLRFKRNIESKFYHDLANSERYQELVVLNESNDNDLITLTLTLTWDGVAYTSDRSKSMWPLCAYLNELPFHKRIMNPMLIALYSGDEKPKSDLMLKPLVDELVKLEQQPLEITIDGKPKRFLVKLLLFIADAPARSVLLNCMQYNGSFGCHVCKIQGTRNPNFNTMTFLPNQKPYDLRKNSEWRQMATSGDNSEGIKGECQLMRLGYIDLPTICPPEPMHSQFLGTVKSIIERWFGTDLVSRRWFQNLSNEQKQMIRKTTITKDKIDIIDIRLATIKFPERTLKSMPQFASPRKLKSLDFELLLYYGWISFIGIVDDAKLNNFKLLAFIISTLSSNYISKGSAIRYAESELKNFFYSFNQVYGANEGFMWKINLHFLEHLPLMVKLYGPLPIQTAYFTENTMGIIAKRVKTGTNVPQQVLKKIINYQTIVSFTTVNNTDCSIEFINQVDDLMPKLGLILHEDQSFSIVSKNIKEPNRIRVSNQLICTKEYNDTRAVSTCNHCIRTTKGKFFIVKKIVQSDDTEIIYTLLCNEFLNCRKLSVYDDKDCTNFNYIYTYSKISNNMCSINLNEFAELATYTEIMNINYIFIIFNKHI